MFIVTTDVKRKISVSWQFKKFVDLSVARHINHDWGDTLDEDKALNEQYPESAMSTYNTAKNGNMGKIGKWRYYCPFSE